MSISDDDLVRHLIKTAEESFHQMGLLRLGVTGQMGLLRLGVTGQIGEANPVHHAPDHVSETLSVSLSDSDDVKEYSVDSLEGLNLSL